MEIKVSVLFLIKVLRNLLLRFLVVFLVNVILSVGFLLDISMIVLSVFVSLNIFFMRLFIFVILNIIFFILEIILLFLIE